MATLHWNRLAALEVEAFKRQVVWGRGHVVPSHDPALYRLDDYGFWIRYADYGNCLSEQGWVFGPAPKGGASGDPGPEDITRLRPVNWRNLAAPGGLLSHAAEAVKAG